MLDIKHGSDGVRRPCMRRRRSVHGGSGGSGPPQDRVGARPPCRRPAAGRRCGAMAPGGGRRTGSSRAGGRQQRRGGHAQRRRRVGAASCRPSPVGAAPRGCGRCRQACGTWQPVRRAGALPRRPRRGAEDLLEHARRHPQHPVGRARADGGPPVAPGGGRLAAPHV